MITVLERQHVSRRVPARADLNAQSAGARWKNDAKPQPRAERTARRRRRPERGAPASFAPDRTPVEHSFLRRQLVRRSQRHAALAAFLRKTETLSRQKTARPPRAPRTVQAGGEPRAASAPRAPGAVREAALSILGSPWLLVGIAAAAALLVAGLAVAPTLGSLAFTGLPLAGARPALPRPQEVDQALYSLVVPDPAPPAAGANPVLLSSLKVARYTIRAGDTLGRVAARFKLNVDTIVSWNGIRDARSLRAGMALDIPNRDGTKYVVRRGDTLQTIARAWGVDLNAVLDANMLQSSVITVGQELFLPGARMSATSLNRVLGSLLIYPVQGRISSWFGDRPDPFTGIRNFHNGVDIVNRVGTPIQAAMAGRVADVGFNYSYGYYVILQHSGGFQTLYGHMTRYVVARGQRIDQGQKIGELGTTGYSTGPHVHFSVFQNGQPVDPMRFLK
jgi:murein DD-endopeptidase MepM/ murein hydrolase activator NlpD